MISYRKAGPQDNDFLFDLYFDSRSSEMASWGWGREQLLGFIAMQFRARSGAYAAAFPGADDTIILSKSMPVGRMLVLRSESEIRLIDIAVMSQHHGRGIGTAALSGLIEEADRSALPIRLQVEVLNTAKRFYERSGFTTVAERAGYYQLERPPKSIL